MTDETHVRQTGLGDLPQKVARPRTAYDRNGRFPAIDLGPEPVQNVFDRRRRQRDDAVVFAVLNGALDHLLERRVHDERHQLAVLSEERLNYGPPQRLSYVF